MAESQGFLQNKSAMQGTAMVLILVSLFVINYGVQGPQWAAWAGGALLAIGLLLAPLSRFTASEDDEGESGDEGQEEERKEEKGEGDGEERDDERRLRS
jgi:hypothetical protein